MSERFDPDGAWGRAPGGSANARHFQAMDEATNPRPVKVDGRSPEQIAYVDRSHEILCEVGALFGLPMPEYRDSIPRLLREGLASQTFQSFRQQALRSEGLRIDTGRLKFSIPEVKPGRPQPRRPWPDMVHLDTLFWLSLGTFAIGLGIGLGIGAALL